jgi:hypothetical protein
VPLSAGIFLTGRVGVTEADDHSDVRLLCAPPVSGVIRRADGLIACGQPTTDVLIDTVNHRVD